MAFSNYFQKKMISIANRLQNAFLYPDFYCFLTKQSHFLKCIIIFGIFFAQPYRARLIFISIAYFLTTYLVIIGRTLLYTRIRDNFQVKL